MSSKRNDASGFPFTLMPLNYWCKLIATVNFRITRHLSADLSGFLPFLVYFGSSSGCGFASG